jgi:hypothetical protein
MTDNFADIYHIFECAKEEFENKLYEICPFEFEKMWCDSYDNSIEFSGLLPEFRLNPEAFEFLKNNGFDRCYLNHNDMWETHYIKTYPEGWRVRYMNKSGGEGILVEEIPKSWSGKLLDMCTIVEKPTYEKIP